MKQFCSYFLYVTLLMVLSVCTATAQQLKGSNPNDQKEYRDLLLKNAGAMGIPKAEVAESIITDAYTDVSTGITFMYVQQAYKGIKVFNVIISSAFKNGGLESAAGIFVPALSAKVGTVTPVKTAGDAARVAAHHLKLNDQAVFTTVADHFATAKKYQLSDGGIAKRPIDVTLVWVASEDKKSVKLAWNVNIDVLGSSDWWNVRVDARTGEYIEKDNWTVNEHNEHDVVIPVLENGITPLPTSLPTPSFNTAGNNFTNTLLAPPNVTTATYRVVPFPIESPLYGAFNNVINPWELAGAGNNATTNGWHFDGTNNYNITRGNNVFTYLDRDATNTVEPVRNWPDTSATTAPSLNFISIANAGLKPSVTENKKAALDNLFYWNNIIHDITYQYGFTEVAGNFQSSNIGRGGAGNDHVLAEAQDGSGGNNANFATPNDGFSGRMQMYLYAQQPTLTVTTPAGIAGVYGSYEFPMGADNKISDIGAVTGQVTLYDSAATTHSGCVAPVDPSKLAGKIVLVDILGCGTNYIGKAKNAQNAGAIAVLAYYPTLAGIGNAVDRTLTIPYLCITTATANTMIAQINSGTPVIVSLTPNGISRDGDFDNGIVTHEYGHGVSNRLTGGPANSSCLQNVEQGGEGWSDYLSLMLTTDWANTPLTAGSTPRPMGNFALSQPTTGVGIRRYPYSTDIVASPLTYANVATNTAVHAVGEVWCNALWEMTWSVIQQTGSINPNLYDATHPGGNSIAFNLVMTGMKLQPCSPGFLDARNAILRADSVLYNGAYRCAIWAAFAKRGMGASAVQGSSNNATDQTAAFDLPSAVRLGTASVQQLLPSSQQVISHTLSCDCSALSGQVVRDTIPAGFTFVSSIPAGATVSGNVVTFPATSFAAGETKIFSLTLQTPAAGCPVDLAINDNRDGSNTGGFVSGGTTGWSNTNTRSHSPTTSWFSTDPVTVTENTLTSAAFSAASSNTLSIISFWHYYNTESRYDGGVVELSTTNGTTWFDAAPYFLSGNYNTAMDAGTVLAGRQAWSGTNLFFKPVMLNVSALGDLPLQVRFRSTSDNGVGGEGWFVDDIVRMNGCGSIIKTGLYNSSNVMTDTIATPVFITSSPLPLRLLNFDAQESNGHVALSWRTASEVNVKNFDVEWSTNNVNWSVIASVAAANQASNRYNSLHADPAAGRNYYRLKIRNIDSRMSSSEIRLVQIQSKGDNQPVLVPNPVSNNAILYISKFSKVTTVNIYDAAGSLVRTLTATAGTQQINISAANLTAGVYIIETTGAARTITKMVVQK